MLLSVEFISAKLDLLVLISNCLSLVCLHLCMHTCYTFAFCKAGVQYLKHQLFLL